MAKYDTIRVFDQASRAGAASEQYSMVLRRYSPHRSVMAVAVDSRIIASHSEIFTAPFTEFLTRVVNAKAFWAQPAPTPNGPQPERTRAGAARPARTSP